MSKNPLLSFGSSGKETTPRFSSLFKLPQLAAGASLDAVGVASAPAASAAAEAQVAAGGSVRLWCTACQAPAYFLSAYGYCGECVSKCCGVGFNQHWGSGSGVHSELCACVSPSLLADQQHAVCCSGCTHARLGVCITKPYSKARPVFP